MTKCTLKLLTMNRNKKRSLFSINPINPFYNIKHEKKLSENYFEKYIYLENIVERK